MFSHHSLRHYWPNDAKGAARLSIEEHIADIATFIAALGLGPVDLLGHSRGGYIAFRVAERRPELLRRLVLAETRRRAGRGFYFPRYGATQLYRLDCRCGRQGGARRYRSGAQQFL